MYDSNVGCRSQRIALSEGDAVYANDAMRDELTDSPPDGSCYRPEGKEQQPRITEKDALGIE